MTNEERIKSMSRREMAEYIYAHDDELNDEICKNAHTECPFGDNVNSEHCYKCIENWLESEAVQDE